MLLISMRKVFHEILEGLKSSAIAREPGGCLLTFKGALHGHLLHYEHLEIDGDYRGCGRKRGELTQEMWQAEHSAD